MTPSRPTNAAVALASPPRVLIVFATSYGQTRRIAERISVVLEEREIEVDILDAKDNTPLLGLATWDAVIVGASIIARGHQPAARRFITRNLDDLNRMPSAFFSVCASAGSAHAQNREAAQTLRADFLAEVGWHPSLAASFAGAINFTEYNWLLRAYMKYASKLNGGSTDTSRNHEYTDWNQVDAFASKVAALVSPVALPAPSIGASGR